MASRKRVVRKNVTQHFEKSSVIKINCSVCGKVIDLWYNGGELDDRKCCGHSYRLETPRIDLVIEDERK